MTTDTPDDDDIIELRDSILDDIKTREQWLRRQAIWYQMRHDGLRRRHKPWPNAADLHFPMADSIIERLKPFYFNQLFATETLASFISCDRDLDAVTGEVGLWFDYKLKQESNIETEILIGIDMMLMAGHDVVKVYWNPDGGEPDETGGDAPGCLAFDAINPSNVIVPQWTKELQEADRITIVHVISVEQYRRDRRFQNKDEDFIKTITGRSSGQDGRNLNEEQLKLIREGTTYSTQDDEITYWEVWQNTAEGWLVHFFSPMEADTPLRPSMRNPLEHGKCPLVRFDVEVKDKGHYASRGIPERIGQFETATCKLWNEKSDYMTLCNRPIFTTPMPIPNAGNMRLIPGQIIAGGLSAVQMPPPPVSFEEEMQANRSVAEQLIGMPDFGQGQDQNTNEPRTATEVQHVSALMNVSVDLRARTFRKSLGELYDLAWQTLLQFDDGTKYVVEESLTELDPKVLAALKEDPRGLRVQPNGSGDSWNRQGQLQKSVARFQMFKGSPFINQGELTKSILELDDPRLVKLLYQDPGQAQADEYSDEAKSIPALMLGMPLPPQPGQDFATRIKCLVDFLHQRAIMGHPPDPVAIQTINGRIAAMLQALHQANPKQAAAVQQSLKSMSEAHQQVAAGQMPQQAPPPGMTGAPGGSTLGASMPPPTQGQAQKPASEQIRINYADAPPDIQRQMEMAAGFHPSTMPPPQQQPAQL